MPTDCLICHTNLDKYQAVFAESSVIPSYFVNGHIPEMVSDTCFKDINEEKLLISMIQHCMR